jgi:SAM-dependent methyltransferase
MSTFDSASEPLQDMHDGLALYDLALKRLRQALGDKQPSPDLEEVVVANAYMIALKVVERGADWEATLRDHTNLILQRAADEIEAERREVALLRRELAGRRRWVLDVGAGWGRLAPLYQELGLCAIFCEPAGLGTRLILRNGWRGAIHATGEALPLSDGIFATAVMGWVLHHHRSGLDAAGILRQIARVMAPGGILLSVEPVRASFERQQWIKLMAGAGLTVQRVEEFLQMGGPAGQVEHPALAVAVKG